MSPARVFARVIIFMLMITAGIAAVVGAFGGEQLALYICGGGSLISVIMLLYGGYIVGVHRAQD